MVKKDAARTLYFEGYKQVDIARVLKVSERSISAWAIDGEWRDKKISIDLMRDNSTARIMELIDYQTKALVRIKNQFLTEDPDSIKLIDKGDIDALQKLHVTIKRDAKKFVDYVQVLKEFMEFMETQDVKMAQELIQFGNLFISAKSRIL